MCCNQTSSLTLNDNQYISLTMDTKWKQIEIDRDSVNKIGEALGCSKILATLLVNRGITTPENARTFLFPALKHLADPFSLKGMNRAVARISQAIKGDEKILVFGDFDADGVTSTTLVVDFLTRSNAEVSWYIPHRQKEGYSLKPEHIEMAVLQKTDLIITVDCGSDSFQAIEKANLEDIDVIVTDHHEVPTSPPPAFTLINPKSPNCQSGLSYLAGVGVAFYLIIALRKYLREKGFYQDIPEPNLRDYCDLVALGTIADMVPLKNENRIMAVTGINVLREGKRPGFNAIAQVSKISKELLDSDDISFRMAPRINAAGRMSHARICVDLLTSREEARAEQSAAILDSLNRKRQETELAILQEIEKMLESSPRLLERCSLVLWHDHWNPGVLGIAASKTARLYHKPTVLITTIGDQATGSCRSVNNINIYDALCGCSQFLERFGGHTMAAGLSLRSDQLPAFAQAFDDKIRESAPSGAFEKTISIDCALNLEEINEELINEVDKLRPFGSGNPEPLFSCPNVKVVSSTIIGTRHLKMILESKEPSKPGRMEALHYNIDPSLPRPEFYDSIAFRVRANRYGKKPYPQIIIEEVRF